LPESELSRNERKERAALKRALSLMRARPAGLEGDLRLVRRLSLGLGRVYPDDAEMSTYLDTVLDNLEADTNEHRGAVRETINWLEPDKVRDKAANLLKLADANSEAAGSAANRAARAAALRRAERFASAAARKAAKGTSIQGGPITETLFTVFVDGEAHSVPADALTVTYTPAHDALPASLVVRASSLGNPIAGLVTLNVSGTITSGSIYALVDSGATLSRTRQLFRAVSGELKVTHLDPEHGVAGGVFSFEGVRAGGGTVSVTDGRFTTIDLVVAQ
jgi:hypothetical protein